jgi:PQQ-like domain
VGRCWDRVKPAKHRLATLGLVLLAAEAVGSAQHWPQFRGEHAGVAIDDPLPPDDWSETKNVAWKIDIPGRGWSSPVVWGEHVFVTTAVNSKQPQQHSYSQTRIGAPAWAER